VETCLNNIHKVMRRPGLLQRADELVACSVGHVLLAMASASQGIDNLKSVGCLHLTSETLRLAVSACVAQTSRFI
jgi:hypothetical protein